MSRNITAFACVAVAVLCGTATAQFRIANERVDDFATWATVSGVKTVKGDFDGDGLSDIALVRQESGWGSVPIAFSESNGRFRITNRRVGAFAAAAAKRGVRVISGDFDADGQTDLALVDQTPSNLFGTEPPGPAPPCIPALPPSSPLPETASLAGLLVSAAVLDGAPRSVHVSDSALESKQTLRIELAPEDVFFYRGEALVFLERNGEAVEQFRKAVELRPKETRNLLRHGEALFVEWRDAEAERAYRAALQLEPNNARAHFLLGELTFQQGQLKAALPFYRRAVELEPDFARAHEMLASTYDLLGCYDEAIAHYERAIQLAPSATRYNELGITYRNKKQLDEAIAQFRAGIEHFPDDALLHRNLATTLVMTGRGDQSGPVFARALQLYRRAAENEPENPDLHASLGLMMAQGQDFEGAIASFRRALALDPRAPLTWGGLGDACISAKRFDDAIDAFLKMVELQREDGFAHHRLGRALEGAGRFGEAEEAFERARRLGYPRQ